MLSSGVCQEGHYCDERMYVYAIGHFTFGHLESFRVDHVTLCF
jgi:hypothetical protein